MDIHLCNEELCLYDLMCLYTAKWVWETVRSKYDELILEKAIEELKNVLHCTWFLVIMNAIRPAIISLMLFVLWLDCKARQVEQWFIGKEDYWGE